MLVLLVLFVWHGLGKASKIVASVSERVGRWCSTEEVMGHILELMPSIARLDTETVTLIQHASTTIGWTIECRGWAVWEWCGVGAVMRAAIRVP